MKYTQADAGTGVSLGWQFTAGWFWIAIVVEGTRQKHSPEIHTPSEKPRRRSSMKVAYHCSQVASHAALTSEGSLMAQSQCVAAQRTNRCMRTGTASANV